MSARLDSLDIHPLRNDLYNELHSRPFQVLPTPARVTQMAVLTTPEQREQQFRHLQELHRLMGHPVPEKEVGCFEHTFGSLRVRREMHMEFASYTFINLDAVDEAPFTETGITPAQ